MATPQNAAVGPRCQRSKRGRTSQARRRATLRMSHVHSADAVKQPTAIATKIWTPGTPIDPTSGPSAGRPYNLPVPPLRVGLDGHAFGSPAGGVRRYVRELTLALVALEPEMQLMAIGAHSGDALPAGVTGVPAGRSLPSNLGWSIDGLPRAIRRTGLDVFHAPAYTAPLWGAHPLVVTIHDVSYARHPEWYPYRIDPVRRWFYRRSAQAADLVITDSEFSRREIEAAYGIPPERIRVIPLGVGPSFAPMADKRGGRESHRSPTMLHVGDLHARRNLRILIDVLAMLHSREDFLRNTSLVLAGADRGAGADILEHAKALGVANSIRFLPAADDQAVVALMHQADVFAYPSAYEGFGLPPLEAMACGTPVIASKASSIPEVIGDAGMLIAPDDVRGWYDAAVSVLTSEPHAAALRGSGLARAASFTWQRTARQTRDVYREVAQLRAGALSAEAARERVGRPAGTIWLRRP